MIKDTFQIIRDFLEFELFSLGEYTLRAYTIVAIFIVFLITKVILWLIKTTMFRKQKQKSLDLGNTYALFQIIKYVIWVIAFAFLLETIGVKITVLVAGSAALLVGIGLGLQQTFNDIVSGIILLSERSIKVGDVLEIDDDIVRIQEIGLRTSTGSNRDEITIIIPNSLITTNKVINWSHQSKKTRFKINVGVAYGSDVDLVSKILKESTLEHPDISDENLVDIRFLDFGNSSLDFQILFYSENIFRIEKEKSDIRKIINRKFTENNISIPFPQMDVHFKK
ncbi:MAG: mechanosensitive ion channel protein MscS [Flavobacteriales bacterium CG03_land_8_20_14_0_80_35_15]|nr:mechanosensitive ion channel [Zetaproteobacteria bacterium]OIO09173.1 MAG: mechanosensitive ion channel protein MscS [Flavobacteriaceae bacterium CG1_02_35_72]PIV16616.1 MAG: mechanosensitive ion channel protein MscS [Flavobacteriales bacterium CG03_land_8_20_14_0_80_35_15]PJA04731.1 MAG: mechanosensitive ion channel protein MscS [Flavobacteriales bacterium CG_4_10_14_0_2_um_filter_35_18]